MNGVELIMVRGTGSAVNVSCGYIPAAVIVNNCTDGDKVHMGFPGAEVLPFTSGGTNTILPGHIIKDATSGATARVTHVILDSGSWAGGDAAGWIIIDITSKVGTFGTHAVYYIGSSGVDDASVTVNVTFGVDVDTEVAGITGNAAITAYVGSSSASLGFTLGSTISEDAKLLACLVFRGSDGSQGLKVANSL